jgi:hypothetical protein
MDSSISTVISRKGRQSFVFLIGPSHICSVKDLNDGMLVSQGVEGKLH